MTDRQIADMVISFLLLILVIVYFSVSVHVLRKESENRYNARMSEIEEILQKCHGPVLQGWAFYSSCRSVVLCSRRFFKARVIAEPLSGATVGARYVTRCDMFTREAAETLRIVAGSLQAIHGCIAVDRGRRLDLRKNVIAPLLTLILWLGVYVGLCHYSWLILCYARPDIGHCVIVVRA